jgi:hypothetical protein
LSVQQSIAYSPAQLDNLVLKPRVRDKIRVMKLPVRLLFAILTLTLASLSPVLPGDSVPSLERKTRCCADMNADASHSCPINRGENNSGCGSTCTTPAGCLLLYFGNANAFIASSYLIHTISLSNASSIARSRRPPVPPPRAAFS